MIAFSVTPASRSSIAPCPLTENDVNKLLEEGLFPVQLEKHPFFVASSDEYICLVEGFQVSVSLGQSAQRSGAVPCYAQYLFPELPYAQE